ncbi:hypothetical protein [Rhizobium sp. RU36D]|uniref:hypothetical protein n=1 Tax=Rhizobium sp. RU36D TaxID=1907415 RepID=UPI0009D911CF|nr:hypothetical protein [Rhizobium sp. RU36D]SMD18243.1 hypothetical protein SAMN05880593_13448 [Rhizobium sp. RU36D]
MSSDREFYLGWFHARYLWPLRTFVDHARLVHLLQFLDGIIVLEPCSSGGAYVVAITGHAMVVIHDSDASISVPCTLDIPDAAFEAAKPAVGPLMDYCGQSYRPDPPDWMQPGRVYVYTAGIHIIPAMRHPVWAEEENEFQPCFYARTASVSEHNRGLDFRMTKGRPLDWRAFLKSTLELPDAAKATTRFDPHIPALFAPLLEMLRSTADTPPAIMSHTTKTHPSGQNPVILQISGHPEVLGVWVGSAEAEPSPIPAHFTAEAST